MAEILQAIGTLLALATSAGLLYNNLKKAPLDRRLEDLQASASAATAITSYSNEVVKLRAEVGDLREMIHEWEAGIELLIHQLTEQKMVPAWRPASRLAPTQPRPGPKRKSEGDR